MPFRNTSNRVLAFSLQSSSQRGIAAMCMVSVEQVLGVSVGELHNFFERDFRDMLVACQLVEEGVRLVGRITVHGVKERAAG